MKGKEPIIKEVIVRYTGTLDELILFITSVINHEIKKASC